MRYYLDTEFDGFGGDLMSLALVREDGPSLYAICSAYAKDDWVKANVVPILSDVPRDAEIQGWYDAREARGFKYHMWLGEDVAEFMKGDPSPHIVADWPDDIRYLCGLLITGPGEMVNIPHLTFEVARVDAYPTTLPGAVQHNAWWDAMALRAKLRDTSDRTGQIPGGPPND